MRFQQRETLSAANYSLAICYRTRGVKRAVLLEYRIYHPAGRHPARTGADEIRKPRNAGRQNGLRHPYPTGAAVAYAPVSDLSQLFQNSKYLIYRPKKRILSGTGIAQCFAEYAP